MSADNYISTNIIKRFIGNKLYLQFELSTYIVLKYILCLDLCIAALVPSDE